MSASLSRNTCFVLLMALEEDVTIAVRDSLPQDVDPFTPDERAQALARLAADKGPQPTPTAWSELAYYLDLNQKLDLVARNRSALAEALGLEPATISAIVSESRSLGSIRNRVCHARPLEEDDLPIVLDTVRLLLSDVPFPLDGRPSLPRWPTSSLQQ